ncbi:hypothetical protein [Chryseolinea sp. T2]|uniref:hypothetical protein n=1 Tax=Chryseolinea sp. T2 TaxID=3129255 RepID=UPI0030780534
MIALFSFAGSFIGSSNLTSNTSLVDHGSHEIDAITKAAIMKSLDNYMNTFNARDLQGWEDTYHFPHYRLASGKMFVLERAGLRDSSVVFTALHKTGWHHSKWEHRNIIHVSADKVHVDTQFSRFNASGQKIGIYESLYILTKENGRWGVKMRSSYAE